MVYLVYMYMYFQLKKIGKNCLHIWVVFWSTCISKCFSKRVLKGELDLDSTFVTRDSDSTCMTQTFHLGEGLGLGLDSVFCDLNTSLTSNIGNGDYSLCVTYVYHYLR